MLEGERNSEIKKSSVLTGEFSDLTNPLAYLEVARQGVARLRELFGSVEN